MTWITLVEKELKEGVKSNFPQNSIRRPEFQAHPNPLKEALLIP
jgi:hypothetical protein